MFRVPKFFALALALVGAPLAAARLDKVDPWVLEQLSTSSAGRTEFLIVLAEQADLSAAAGVHGKDARGAWVHQRLTEVAARS